MNCSLNTFNISFTESKKGIYLLGHLIFICSQFCNVNVWVFYMHLIAYIFIIWTLYASQYTVYIPLETLFSYRFFMPCIHVWDWSFDWKSMLQTLYLLRRVMHMLPYYKRWQPIHHLLFCKSCQGATCWKSIAFFAMLFTTFNHIVNINIYLTVKYSINILV